MSQTANRSALLAASKIIVIGLNAVLLMLLSRLFTTHDYGVYKDIVLKETLISIIGEMGLTSAAIYFISGKKKEEYLSGIINFSVILAAVSIPFSLYFSPLSGLGSFLFVVMVILKLFTITTTNMMIGAGKNRFLLLFMLAPPGVTLFLVVVMSFTGSSLFFLISILTVRRVVEMIISCVFWFNIGNPFKLSSRSVLREIFYFSLPLAVSSVVGVLNMNIDKLMVKTFFSIEDFAVFSNGAYELPVLQIFSGSLFTVMIPRLKELKEANKIDEVVKKWKSLGEITATIVVPLTITLIIFADSFILFMFSDKYAESIGIFRIYQIKNLFRIYLYGSIFIAFAENRKLLINSMLSLMINTALNLIFIQFFGINGIAAATVISLFILVVLQCFQISRFLSIRISQTYPVLKWAGMIILCVPITYVMMKLTSDLILVVKVAVMIGVTGVNILMVSIVFNRTIIDFVMNKIRRIFKRA